MERPDGVHKLLVSAAATPASVMAIVVIGGLMTSTALSLVAIPVIFTFVNDFLGLLKQLVCPR
ncbi:MULTISPECIES: hypothetical protein [unclassified Mesorhizobium]|uniref:hypothetical protein n=1 Tax=unclassified Mesorhizobium TaxID=325217 RepID=UPI0018C976BE|nr:hypothetical protein [Mesorhizobium sp. L2C085B000]